MSTDDWESIIKRKKLRVLVSPSRSNFFIAKNQVRGFEYEIFQQFESYIRNYSNLIDFQVEYIPVGHHQLIPMLNKGYGDVAAAMLTITEDRKKLVDFSSPYIENINEILISHNKSEPISLVEDLSGKNIYIADGSSYISSINQLNKKLHLLNLKPVKIHTLKKLNTEDILEMVNAEIFDYTIADHTIAELWQQVLPNIRLDEHIKVGKDKKIAWAVRKNNPDLKNKLSVHAQKKRQGSLLGNIFFKRYYRQAHWLGVTLEKDFGRFNEYKKAFQKAGEKYDIDWILIAMQAYQESRFIPNAKSSAGAVGIMQLLPSTAKDMQVEDIYDPEDNIMGGARYMSWIKTNYFKDPEISTENKICFYLAAYNAGFKKVQMWRKKALEYGYDPNIWFGNLSVVALHETGLEPVYYVSNIMRAYHTFPAYLNLVNQKARIKKELEF